MEKDLYVLSWLHYKWNGEEDLEIFWARSEVDMYQKALPTLLYKWKELVVIPESKVHKDSVDFVNDITNFSRKFTDMLISDKEYQEIVEYGKSIGLINMRMIFNLYFEIHAEHHRKPEWHTTEILKWDYDNFILGSWVVFKDSTGAHRQIYHYIFKTPDAVYRTVSHALIQWWYLFDDSYRKHIYGEHAAKMMKIHDDCKKLSTEINERGRQNHSMTTDIYQYISTLSEMEIGLLVKMYFTMIPWHEDHDEMWFMRTV